MDAGPLVALCDPRDSLHRQALEDLEELAARGLSVCEAVLVETCFHLPHDAQRRRLRAVLDELDVQPVSTHERELRDDIFEWLSRYAEHQPDWADGCIAVLCGRDERLGVWTYDEEFSTTWRTPGGKVIPVCGRG